ncbi:MAG: hypothetical protein ACD_75C02640G0002 [uncultured bacterium]|nr:MAG: hypothetical protein ACD_75C02640G0002 [uncultured bacterium]
MNTSIPRDLMFDDEPIEGILYGVDGSEATPADIFEYWRGGYNMLPESFEIVMTILAKSPEKGSTLEDRQRAIIQDYVIQSLPESKDDPTGLLKLACICQAVGNLEKAEAIYRLLLDRRDGGLPLTVEQCRQAMDNLSIILNQLGKADEASEERKLCQAEMLLSGDDEQNLISVRSLALDLFVDGRYQAAERLYRSLLSREFEKPGTLVHLARVLLMQDRIPEARNAIARAWKLTRKKEMRDQTSSYVLHRIFFFRILCAMLTRDDYSRPVAELKQELQDNPIRVTWSIGPVIEHLKPYVRPSDLEFVMAVAKAIDTTDNIERLNSFPIWRGETVSNGSGECTSKTTSER